MRLNGEVERLEDSPCTGWCTTRQWGDERCKGCGRYETEISGWDGLEPVYRKLRVLQNAEEGFPVRHLKTQGWRPTPRNITEIDNNE